MFTNHRTLLSHLRIAVSAIACGVTAAQAQVAQQLPTQQLNAGIHIITAELAQTESQREIGLMFRKAMAPNHGMLFSFDRPGTQCFWMKDTLLPLDVAFVQDDGVIVNIDRMQPRSLDSHCSAKPVQFVLEMNKGWFAKRGITAGTRITGKPFTR
jgi:uncharacterized protein